MNQKKTHHWGLWITFAALVLAACMPPALQQSLQVNLSRPQAHYPVGPYDGPVNLKIDTGLMSGQTGKVVDLNQVLAAADGGFKTQAVPDGPVVYQETFSKDKGNLEILREFRVQDNSRRYTLHVAKSSNHGHKGWVNANINGTDWIKERDFSVRNAEAEKASLLLNAKNTLRLRLRGQKGLSVTVTVVEGGQAGTVLRRQGRLGIPDETQATHVRQNDTNIFDPNDPDSLGGLQPYEGDQSSDQYSELQIGSSEANGTLAKFVVGQIAVVVKEPVADNLAALQERYPVTVIHEKESLGYHHATLQVDLPQARIDHLLANIQTLNQREDFPALTDASFSSVNSAKTIALAMDLMANAQDLIHGLALEHVMDKHQSFVPDSTEQLASDPLPVYREHLHIASPAPPPVVTNNNSRDLKASDLWWLESVHARQAWDYSMGGGTTVAVLDSNFAILAEDVDVSGQSSGLIVRNDDFAGGRVSFLRDGYHYLYQTKPRCTDLSTCNNDAAVSPDGQGYLRNGAGHGLWVSNVLAAGFDDSLGIVGVAPRATIQPMMATGSMSEITAQLERIDADFDTHPVDVVNISQGQLFNFYHVFMASQEYARELVEKLNSTLGLELVATEKYDIKLLDMIRALATLSIERNVIIVVSAGNEGVSSPPSNSVGSINWIGQVSVPAALPFTIAVGAYQVENNGGLTKAVFDLFPVDVASNRGWYVDIWAPGKGLWIRNVNDQFEGSSWVAVEGTSYAAPMVAGAVALLRSLNPSLDNLAILDILHDSSDTLNDASFIPDGTDPALYSGTFALNIFKAVQDPRVGAQPAAEYCLQYAPTTTYGFSDVNEEIPGAGSVRTYPELSEQFPDLEPGDYVLARGWTKNERNTQAIGTIHVLQAEQTDSCQDGGFGTLAVTGDRDPNTLPNNHFVYRLPGVPYLVQGQTAQINANEFAKIAFNQPVKGISVKIGPVEVPIVDVLSDLAIIGIPEDLPAGVHDVVINTTVGNLTLEDAVEKVDAEIPVVPEPKAPPSTDPGDYEAVRVFNVEGNDEARVYLNDELLATAHAGDDLEIPLGDYYGHPLHTDQRNEFRFELDNNGGGYTLGFELRDSYYKTRYRDIRGKAGEQSVFNDQRQEDQTQGKVYTERFITNQAASLPVGNGPYWVKVFNMNDDESLFIYANNQTYDPEWSFDDGGYTSDGYFVEPEDQPVAKALPWPVDCPGYGGCGVIFNPLSFSLSNQTGNYSYGLEVFKGINLIYRNIHGQRGGWGADDNNSPPFERSEVAGIEIMDY